MQAMQLMHSLYNAVVYVNSSDLQYWLTFSPNAPTSSLLFIDFVTLHAQPLLGKIC